ncbi:hypothetical protein [Fischerella sp. PCC 9605]|uniref:hypothetical protein n=1 Tax=Fischerella sp. PCC 9605 TaxID=1173024 RepID=UPI0012DBD4CF
MALIVRKNRERISPYDLLNKQMEPREFCQRWFKSTADQEQVRGYREKCVDLLAKVLKVKANTIQRWGSGLDFEGIPEQYKATLSYADIIRTIIEATNAEPELVELVVESLKSRN